MSKETYYVTKETDYVSKETYVYNVSKERPQKRDVTDLLSGQRPTMCQTTSQKRLTTFQKRLTMCQKRPTDGAKEKRSLFDT